MDTIQPLLAVFFVLGALAVTLYWLRAKGVARFSTPGLGKGVRRLQAVERLALTPQHSLHLVNVSGRTLLIAVSPNGCAILDGASQAAESETVVR